MTLRDLSQPLESGMPVYPGGDPATVEPGFTFEDGGIRTTEFSLDSHNGTHVDAPSHMARDGKTLDDFAIEDFRFQARLVDCTDLGPREPLPVERLPKPSDETDLLVFHTGWSEHWGTDRYFDHPYLSAGAAEAAATAGFDVAFDVMSPDPTPRANPETSHTPDATEPDGHPAHDALFGANRRIIENLRNLAGLPDEFTLPAYPLPLGGDGAQVRAVAEF